MRPSSRLQIYSDHFFVHSERSLLLQKLSEKLSQLIALTETVFLTAAVNVWKLPPKSNPYLEAVGIADAS